MKIENLEFTHEDDTYIFATVDITTGYLWWRKTKRVVVHKRKKGLTFWRYLDSGEMTPEFMLEDLEQAARAKMAFTTR